MNDLPFNPLEVWLRRSRSQTSSGERHARTRWLQSWGRGKHKDVTDEQDRERESRLTEENKFVELQEEVADETRQLASWCLRRFSAARAAPAD